MMQTDHQDLSALVKEVRRQLSLSQEGLARELGVSFATVNRWENNHVKPSKLARAQLDAFCLKNDQSGETELLNLNDYQAKYFAHELTRRFPPDSVEKVTVAFAGAQVDLNPHQIDAALFAFKSPLSRGALLASGRAPKRR